MSGATFVGLWTAIVIPLLGGGGIAGLYYSKKKAKATAESVVISNADSVVKMYEMLAHRQQDEIHELQEHIGRLEVDLEVLRGRNRDLERALFKAGIEVNHEK